MAATDPSVKTHRWRRVEYDQLVELGIFTGERLEVNLVDRVLEVYRDPQPTADAPYRAVYVSVDVLRPPATVTPLAAPHAQIAVADLLP